MKQMGPNRRDQTNRKKKKKNWDLKWETNLTGGSVPFLILGENLLSNF